MSPAAASLTPAPAVRVTAWLLAAAGTLPFLAAIADAARLGGIGTVQIYGAVIASFVCGMHWGAALFAPEPLAVRLFLLSNVAALFAWLAALLTPQPGFLLLAVIFAALLGVDRHLRARGVWAGWFWQLRVAISAVVVSACGWIGMAA
ncbi:DUF3429 domain-containing protein [Ancylobacter rudongensis]|uniref:DUF3429 domain-containing protein n=1 Tax=Ancylobacter rudongensis TaxID=177413 RepID=A0A1G4RBP1_9HYPH|nr:DUF3429 domain-containing protein [Ancylobacter rudongensis]SCW54343.1 Protein of unknown function [Ancylobacter rudongensis]